MDPFLILAMIVASVVTHAWEQSKRRSAAAWAEAAERADARDKARRARVVSRTRRLRTARSAGPRDPLWWPYALGWVTAGAVRAGHAGVQGVREGIKIGAPEGRRFGEAAARRGWTLRRTWEEYRRRRAAAAPTTGPTGEAAGGTADELIVEECPACGVYVSHLVVDRELGRACAPCADWRAAGDERAGAARHEHVDNQPEHDHESVDKRHDEWACDGTCTSSDVGPAEAERAGLCPDCGGPGEYVWNFGDEHGHTPCPTCNPDGQRHKRPRVHQQPGEGHEPRCSGGLIAGHRGCPDCIEALLRDGHTGSNEQLEALLIDRWDAAEARAQDPGEDTRDAHLITAPDGHQFVSLIGGAAYVGVPGYGVEPVQGVERRDGFQITNHGGNTMIGSLTNPHEPPGMVPAYTGGPVRYGSGGTTGEGYTDTVTTLQTLARQLAAAHETAQNLAENLSAEELDTDTLNRINDLMEQLDAAAPLADSTSKHVVARHQGVAEAVAAAGGSTNVARKAWYDDV